MKFIKVFLLFFLTNIVFGQDIPYSIDVFDSNQTPRGSAALKQRVSGDNGVYFVSGQSPQNLIVSFFDGEIVKPLYVTNDALKLVGSTEQGVFAICEDILFISNSGRVDTLNESPVTVNEHYLLGNTLYTFSMTSGIRSFTAEGGETLLSTDINNCSGTSIKFHPVLDRLFYQTCDRLGVSDGTPGGTFTIIEEEGELYEYNGLVLHVSTSGRLSSYDPEANRLTDLSANPPNIGVDYIGTDLAVLTRHGLLFRSSTEDTGKELFISDGTREGTTLLLELNAGPADGIVGFSDSPVVASIDNYLVFMGGSVTDSGEIWISDGSVSGTFPIIELPQEESYFRYSINGRLLSNGRLVVAVNNSEAEEYSSYLYALDPSDPQSPTVLDSLVISLANTTYHEVNERLFLEFRDGLNKTLISYDVISVAKDTIAELSFTADRLGIVGDFATYLVDEESGLRAIMATQGLENDFVKIISTVSNSSGPLSYADIFCIRDQFYIYAFDVDLGESIYQLNTDDFSAELITDIYPFTQDGSVEFIASVGNNLFRINQELNRPDSIFGYLLDQSTQSFTPVVGRPDANPRSDELVGNIGTKFYYSSELSHDKLTVFDVATNEWKNLSHLIPSESVIDRNIPLVLNGKLYSSAYYRLRSPSRLVFNLMEIDPLAETSSILLADTTTEVSVITGRDFATDGERLYFGRFRDNNQGPAIYDPEGNSVVDVGPVEDDTYLIFKRFGSRVAVEYIEQTNGLNPPGKAYWVSDDGLGQELELRISPLAGDCFDLGERILLAPRSGSLYATNKLTGDSTVLVDAGGVAIRQSTRISEEEVVFFRKGVQDNDEWFLWRTDGTKTGTRKVNGPPGQSIGPPSSIAVFGNYLGMRFSNRSPIYLFDPSAEVWQEIPSSTVDNETPGIVGIADELYFVARHPVFGEELHVLEIGLQQLLSGRVFRDANGNGVFDSNETGIPNASVKVVGNGATQTVFTQEDGSYEFLVKEGDRYEISTAITNCYESLTTPEEYSIEYAPDPNYFIDFGYENGSGEPRLRTLLNSGTIRCGFELNFWLTIINDGCVPLAGEASVVLPEEVEFISADQEPSSFEEGVLRFAFDPLGPGNSNRISLRLRMPDENFVGLPVNLETSALSSIQEQDIVSDTFQYSEILLCANDPNDKQVFPVRPEETNSNYTQIDEKIRYTIRFQNMGNDTAFTVRILDEIAEGLNLSTLRPLAGSHPFKTSVRKERTVEFFFEDIFLPNSTTNFQMSQGYVTFEISPESSLDDTTILDNTAGIFFDFNRPVITNTVTSTIVEFLDQDQDGFPFYEDCNDENILINPAAEEVPGNGIDENCDDSDFPVSIINPLSGNLSIFPNPAREIISITYSENKRLNLELISAMGIPVMQTAFSGQINLSLSKFPKGVYIVRVWQEESGSGSSYKLILQ